MHGTVPVPLAIVVPLVGERAWLYIYNKHAAGPHRAQHQVSTALAGDSSACCTTGRHTLLRRPTCMPGMCGHSLQPWLMEHSTLGLAEFRLSVQLVSAAPPDELHWADSAAQLAPLLASVLGLFGHQVTPATGGRPRPGRLNSVLLRGTRSRAMRAEVLSSCSKKVSRRDKARTAWKVWHALYHDIR